MREWKKGYKVLEQVAGGLGGRAYWKHRVIYKPYKQVDRKRGWGPLACFATIEDAISFVEAPSEVIYSCLYVESKERVLYMTEDHVKIWQAGVVPITTVFANSIIIMEAQWTT